MWGRWGGGGMLVFGRRREGWFCRLGCFDGVWWNSREVVREDWDLREGL